MRQVIRLRRPGLIFMAATVALAGIGCELTSRVLPSAVPPSGHQPSAVQPSPSVVPSTVVEPTPTSQPVVTPELTPEASCYHLLVEVDYLPQPLTAVARRSRSVAVGTFAGYGQAAWNTPDGQRPTQAALRRSSAMIFRLVNVTDVEMLRGDAADLAIA